MITRTRLIGAVATIALAGMMFGCGGGSSSTSASYVQTGKLVGGPVTGAAVFADSVSGGTRFVQDGNEIAAATVSDGSASDGLYTLPQLPSYSYILVSRGGTDKITGVPAIQMLAPAGASNITPLTTLVTLDQSGLLRAKLESMLPNGAKYDADVSLSSSPAVLLLVKSIETATRSLTDAIVTQSGYTLAQMQTQNAYIQTRIMQSIAAKLAESGSTVAAISTPTTLTSLLTSALDNAIVQIRVDNQNTAIVGSSASIAATVATGSVTAAVNSLGNPTASSPLVTSVVFSESSLANAGSTFLNAVVTTVSQIIGTTITSVLTPATFVPPQVPVFTYTITQIITGATGGTGGSGTGTQF